MPDPAPFQHSHRFNEGSPLAEKNTLQAAVITAIMMMVEIVGGYALNSMALLADGWHMSSHALALGVSSGACVLARRLSTDRRFAFGTWKIEVLGGYSSALLLCVVAVLMLVQSVERLVHPAAIHYDQAIPIAVVGLLVNLLCAWLLKDGHPPLRTRPWTRSRPPLPRSELAFGLPACRGQCRHLRVGDLGAVGWEVPRHQLAGSPDGHRRRRARRAVGHQPDRPHLARRRHGCAGGRRNPDVVADKLPDTAITDHVWRVGKGRYACILALVTDQPLTPAVVRGHLAAHEELAHVTVEIAKADAPAIVFLPGNSAPDGKPVTAASASWQERSEGPGSPS